MSPDDVAALDHIVSMLAPYIGLFLAGLVLAPPAFRSRDQRRLDREHSMRMRGGDPGVLRRASRRDYLGPAQRHEGPDPYMARHVESVMRIRPWASCPQYGSNDVGGDGYWTTNPDGSWGHHRPLLDRMRD